jgi:hypothetical protein
MSYNTVKPVLRGQSMVQRKGDLLRQVTAI